MKKDEIKLADLERLLLGEAPAMFLLEVLIRSLITFILLIIVMRLLGKRMSGKLTHTELSVMLMLGAVVSSAMQIPERGIAEGAFVLFVIYVLQRTITYWTVKKPIVENYTFGKMNLLVKDGIMQLDAMEKEKMSRNELFRLLRVKNIQNLGMVRRLYMESSGGFTIYTYPDQKPGLAVAPQEDKDLRNEQQESAEFITCQECGNTITARQYPRPCSVCENNNWETSTQ